MADEITSDIYKRLRRSKAGWCVISVVIIALGAFAVWSSLPDDIKKELIGRFTTHGKSEKPEPPKPPEWKELSIRAYASSDGPRSERKEISIPAGWKYVEHTTAEETRAGSSTYETGLVRDSSGAVTSVWVEVKAEPRQLFGAGSWMGRVLTVKIESL